MDLPSQDTKDTRVEGRYTDSLSNGQASSSSVQAAPPTFSPIEYKVSKRRRFGLIQLVLLNIIVSWDVSFKIHPDSLLSTVYDESSVEQNWLYH